MFTGTASATGICIRKNKRKLQHSSSLCFTSSSDLIEKLLLKGLKYLPIQHIFPLFFKRVMSILLRQF